MLIQGRKKPSGTEDWTTAVCLRDARRVDHARVVSSSSSVLTSDPKLEAGVSEGVLSEPLEGDVSAVVVSLMGLSIVDFLVLFGTKVVES